MATSGLEMSQNSMRLSWGFEEVDTRLKEIMRNIYRNVSQTAREFRNPDNLAMGANIAGFMKVARAMLAQESSDEPDPARKRKGAPAP